MKNGTGISSDLINRRLGGGGKGDFHEPEVLEIPDGQSGDEGLSAGFIAKMLVLFVAVGGGTYFLADTELSWHEVKLAIGGLSRFQF